MISKDSVIIAARILRTHPCMRQYVKHSRGQKIVATYANWALDELATSLYTSHSSAEDLLIACMGKSEQYAEFFDDTHKSSDEINPFKVMHDTILQIYRKVSDEEIARFGYGYDNYIM